VAPAADAGASDCRVDMADEAALAKLLRTGGDPSDTLATKAAGHVLLLSSGGEPFSGFLRRVYSTTRALFTPPTARAR
jgi:hypothetical protein